MEKRSKPIKHKMKTIKGQKMERSPQVKNHTQNHYYKHSDDNDSHDTHSTTEDSVFNDPLHDNQYHPSHFHKQSHRSSSTSSTSITSSSSSSSSTSSSFSSSSSSSTSFSSSSSSSESDSERSNPRIKPQHSRSCTDISRKTRYFDECDDTAPLLEKDEHLDRNQIHGSTPQSGSCQGQQKNLRDESIRKAKSMESLARPKQNEPHGAEQDERKNEARNIVKEKIQFSAFLNEITRQVLSPMRLTTLGVTKAQRPHSPVQGSAGSSNPENSKMKQEQQTHLQGSADSASSGKHSQSSIKRSHSHQRHYSHRSVGSPDHKTRRSFKRHQSWSYRHRSCSPSDKHHHHPCHHHRHGSPSNENNYQHRRSSTYYNNDHHKTSRHHKNHRHCHYNDHQYSTTHHHKDYGHNVSNRNSSQTDYGDTYPSHSSHLKEHSTSPAYHRHHSDTRDDNKGNVTKSHHRNHYSPDHRHSEQEHHQEEHRGDLHHSETQHHTHSHNHHQRREHRPQIEDYHGSHLRKHHHNKQYAHDHSKHPHHQNESVHRHGDKDHLEPCPHHQKESQFYKDGNHREHRSHHGNHHSEPHHHHHGDHHSNKPHHHGDHHSEPHHHGDHQSKPHHHGDHHSEPHHPHHGENHNGNLHNEPHHHHHGDHHNEPDYHRDNRSEPHNHGDHHKEPHHHGDNHSKPHHHGDHHNEPHPHGDHHSEPHRHGDHHSEPHHHGDHHSESHPHGDHHSEPHRHGDHHSEPHHHHQKDHHSEPHHHHHGDHQSEPHHHGDPYSEPHHHQKDHHSEPHHHRHGDHHSEPHHHHQKDHHSEPHHHGDPYSEPHHHQKDHHSEPHHHHHGDHHNEHYHHGDDCKEFSHLHTHNVGHSKHPERHCNSHFGPESPQIHSKTNQCHTGSQGKPAEKSSRPASASSQDEEQTSFSNVLHKESADGMGQIIILQEQNEGLQQSLFQTAVRVECLGEEFMSTRHSLEAELQRTRMELSNLTDRFKRLHDNCSSTQQTVLEHKLHSVAQNMEGERERLNKHVSALTEQLADAKFVNSVDTSDVRSPSYLISWHVLKIISLFHFNLQATQRHIPPVAPPPVQFMDSLNCAQDKVAGQEQSLGSVPEEEESDWSEIGEETPRFVLTGFNRGQAWRQRESDEDKTSESGREDIFQSNSSRPSIIPHLQFTVHNEILPLTHTNLSNIVTCQSSFQITTNPSLGSAVLVRSASLEEIPLACHSMPKELRGTEAMMDLHHSGGAGAIHDFDNEFIHHLKSNRDTAHVRQMDCSVSEMDTAMSNLQSAERILNHLISETQHRDAEVHGWCEPVPDELLKGERTKL
ncbi:uncharacterized protein [Eucyclogobius newberryi]|uniref:uncharacterized protein isoform X2 n=1 Tax=Eucyclogobius newberryi TaxID=166745 RepID=UPI003B5973A4